MGEHEFNKRSKTKELKPVSEIVMVPVPPIIDRETFDAVQKLLKARNPKVMPARVISGPTLLTGLIHCAKCGEIGRAHVCTPVTNAHLVCSLLLDTKKIPPGQQPTL